jgi:hypothetical protein
MSTALNKKLEHPLDRLKRLGVEIVIKRDLQDGIIYRYTGVGNSHPRLFKNPVTKLNTCQLCGRMSTLKKVYLRNDVYRWNCENGDYKCEGKDTLCTGCWNKVRPLVMREREAKELSSFINRIKKEIRNERKN